MKKCLLSGLFLLFVLLPFRATNKVDLSGELETALKLRNQYSRQKETRIDSLKHLLYPNMNDDERFLLYNAIYEEYYTYRFDSAIYYVDREEEVAMKLSNPTYRNLSIIHRSILLATSGYFSESIQNLEQIDSRTLDNALRIEYYTAYEWAYSMWAEYSNDNIYAPRYYEKEMLYQIHLSVFYQSVHRCIITGKAKTSIVIAGMPKLKIAIKKRWKDYRSMSACLLWQLTDWHWCTHEPTTGKNMRII